MNIEENVCVIGCRWSNCQRKELFMKKFFVCLALFCVFSSSVSARPFHHWEHRPHPGPAPVVVHRTHHVYSGEPWAVLASGLVGFAAGSVMASSTPAVYSVTVPEDKQCFAVVSKSNGSITQHCLSGNNQVLYVE